MGTNEIEIVDVVYRPYYQAYQENQMIGIVDVAKNNMISIDEVKRSILFLESENRIEFDNKGFDPLKSGPVYKLTKTGYSWFAKTNYVNELIKSRQSNNVSIEMSEMNIFISHASANKEYGNALVDLLTSIGIQDKRIIFTSNTAHGIPTGKNIFDWLKTQIADKSFVIYLLSKEYYESIACLNEMGAAWVIENEHAVMFLPDFDLGSKAFQNGAIDPREIGFHVSDHDRLLQFCYDLKKYFPITENSVRLSQRVKHFLAEITSLHGKLKLTKAPDADSKEFAKVIDVAEPIKETVPEPNNPSNRSLSLEKKVPQVYRKFLDDIKANKFLDTEFLLLHYILDRTKTKLDIGWQATHEVAYIKDWEDVNGLNNKLSNEYDKIIRRFELKGYTEPSAWTSHGNPKEVQLKVELSEQLFDFPDFVVLAIKETVERNLAVEHLVKDEEDDLPF